MSKKMKLFRIAIILGMTVFTMCGRAGNNEDLVMKFEQQKHRVEISENILIYNDTKITLGSITNIEIDSILNYNGISIIPTVENDVFYGAEIIFANQIKEWEALRLVINDDPETEILLNGNGQLKGILQGFGDAEAVKKRIFDEIKQYGYSKLPIEQGPSKVQSMLFIPVYNKTIPDWYPDADVAIVKFNNIDISQNTIIDLRNEQSKEWKSLGLEESEGQEINGKYVPTEYRLISNSIETYIKVNESGRILNLKWRKL